MDVSGMNSAGPSIRYGIFKVESAGILKRALKEIDALGGDYVSVLLKGAEI